MAYADGKIVEKDDQRAVYWYEKAAMQGHKEACANLGFCYKFGNGVEKNPGLAFEWCMKSGLGVF